MALIRAKTNGNVVDVPEPRAGKLVRAGIFAYVEHHEPRRAVPAPRMAPVAPAPPPPPAPDPVVAAGADLERKTRRELEELADGLDVAGTGTNGYVTKADLVRALAVRYGRRDLRAED